MESIRYTADLVLFALNPDGSMDSALMIERRWPPFQARLALPGGHVDPGETSRHAAVRELAEETGVQLDQAHASPLLPLGVFDAPDRDPRGRYISAAYTATVPDALDVAPADDAVAALWVPMRLLRSYLAHGELAFDHTVIVMRAISAVRDQLLPKGAI